MGKWIEGKLKKEQADEKRRHRNDKYADFCFALANTIIGSLVIACVLSLIQEDLEEKATLATVVMTCGIVMSFVLFKIGGNLLK